METDQPGGARTIRMQSLYGVSALFLAACLILIVVIFGLPKEGAGATSLVTAPSQPGGQVQQNGSGFQNGTAQQNMTPEQPQPTPQQDGHVWPPWAPVVDEPYATQYPNITYAEANGTKLLMDIFVPKNGTGPYPVIMFVHGGGWAAGTRESCPYDLAKDGYALACIEYRFSWIATFPAQIHDVKAAVRWLRANAGAYNLDSDHIGAMGDSAGGHLVALLGTSGGVPELEGDEGNLQFSSRVQAVVDYFGPTDFIDVENYSDVENSTGGYPGYATLAAKLFGGEIKDNHALAIEASPLTYVSPDDPPFFITHARKDETVPYSQSVKLDEALRSVGVESTLVLEEGDEICQPASHCYVYLPEIKAAMLEFLERHLKRAGPDGNAE